MSTQFEVEALVEEAQGYARREIMALVRQLNPVRSLQVGEALIDNPAPSLSPIRQNVALLVAVANNEPHAEEALEDGEVQMALQDVLELLFSRPAAVTYSIPDEFWDNPGLGQLCSAVGARINARRGTTAAKS